MATTYGYGGEFSSDEDIDRIEQQSDRFVQSKFDSHAQVKPTKNQIEEAIETIKRLPLDQDVNLTDELLAGLLDHYRTQRGPIVDSTRNLYKKIVLRLIRGEQQASNGDAVIVDNTGNSNGGAISSNTINNNNNVIINHNLAAKHVKPQQAPYELGSSDEDEPMLPASQSSNLGNRLDKRVLHNNNDKIEPMEVDSETPSSQLIRANQPRQVENEMTSSSSSSESSTDESSDESDSDSEVLDLTPVKNQALQSTNAAVSATKVNTKIVQASRERKAVSATTPVQTSSILAAKSNSEAVTDSKKKPYTRSQRAVATRSTSKQQQKSLRDDKKTNVSSSKQVDASASASSGVKPPTKGVLQSKFKAKYVIFALIVALFAFVLFHFRLDLTKSTDRVFKRAINF